MTTAHQWKWDAYGKPFKKRSKKKEKIKEYRLVVKRKKNKSGQVNMITQDAYDYRSIITNDFEKSAKEIAHIYNQRGGMERTFDILKNDFGWDNMPFSTLERNHVFLILTAVVSNLYKMLIKHRKMAETDFQTQKVHLQVILPESGSKKAGKGT